jgi:DNA polymerase-1
LNFGLLYGMGEASLAMWLGVTLAEAKALKARYFAEIPEAADAIGRAKAMMIQHGYMRTLLGRKRRFLEPRKKAYAALNAACQGGNADILKLKICEIDDYLESLDNGAYYAFSIHDSNEFMVPEGDFQTPAEVLRLGEDFTDAPFTKPLTVNQKIDLAGGIKWNIASYPDEYPEEVIRLAT